MKFANKTIQMEYASHRICQQQYPPMWKKHWSSNALDYTRLRIHLHWTDVTQSNQGWTIKMHSNHYQPIQLQKYITKYDHMYTTLSASKVRKLSEISTLLTRINNLEDTEYRLCCSFMHANHLFFSSSCWSRLFNGIHIEKSVILRGMRFQPYDSP